MEDKILPTKTALTEALNLSSKILEDIELSTIPLENIALKVSRLSRLLNDFDMQKIIEYEVSGYPSSPKGLHPDIYYLAVAANREYEKEEDKTVKKYIYGTSISSLENGLKFNETALQAAVDPNIALSSANPNQFISDIKGNAIERIKIRTEIFETSSRLASRRSFLYHYVLKKHYELKFSGIADDIFSRVRSRVDSYVGNLLPDAVKKFNAIYDNLQSDNQEDWSNAVHGCRRILQDMADIVFPATEKKNQRNGKDVKLGKDNYINRIIAFVEDSCDSKRFQDLVGSHIQFLGDRLDSIFRAAQKGSHDNILTQEEADRYIAYTYLIVGDILSLWNERENSQNGNI